MANIVQSVRGTRDFYPEQMAVRNWLNSKIRYVSQLFGYQEYDGPFLERLELYAAKSGEELVKEQAYVFEDRGGEEIALRPELTPSLARMVAQRQGQLVYPIRWWSFGPFWRYEKPQKGRTREFFQWNIDIIGIDSIEADAEIVAIAASFLQQVGLTADQVGVFINDRKFMDEQLAKLGVGSVDSRRKVFQLIDRRDKLQRDAWVELGSSYGLSNEVITGVESLISNKDLWKSSSNLTKLFELTSKMGIGEYVHFDPQIIRGLDYYTAVVFEAKTIGKGGRAILGGGHYDNLVEAVGGAPLPAVGFAMGDVMIATVLSEAGLLGDTAKKSAEIFVTAFEPANIPESVELASELRSAGFRVLTPAEPAKLQKQLKYADRYEIPIVIIQGPDENATSSYTLKNLLLRTQVTVNKADLVPTLNVMLADGTSV